MNIHKPKTPIVLVAFLVIVTIPLGTCNVRGVIAHTSSPVSQDAYVWSGNPDFCYGHNTGLIVGNYTANWTETYILFSLANRPAQWLNAVLYLGTTEWPTNLTGYLQETSTSWSEDTITWNNRPNLLTYTEPVNITYPNLRVNLTTFLRRYDTASGLTNVSFVLNSTPVADGNYSAFWSRDGGEGTGPNLYWRYEEAEPFNPAPIVIAAAGIGAGIAVTTVVVKRRGKKKLAPEAAKPDGFDDLKFST